MATRKTRAIKGSLKKKGFKESTNDHFWYVFYFNGKKSSIRTKISHGTSEYGNSLLSKMAGQLRISNSELLELIDCPLSEKEYSNILIEKKIIY
ncbi:MAG: hypothetical protein KAH57_05390 [Thermoplasmata archaeon]|nr:hypothetical protein [Thermoplasmata archaeon]